MNWNSDLLVEKCFGNQELVEVLVKRFRESLPDTVNSILIASTTGNFDRAYELAHCLKGESGTMCVPEISLMAQGVCDLAKSQDSDSLIELAQKLVLESATFCEALQLELVVSK